MAKSGRKRKKAEKSKTKLRQSIKLPKGLNETQTEISARKITVLNQLKNRDELAAGDHDEGSSGVSKVTKRKIGIKDLMHKVCSNGISIKLEGLEGLNEIAKLYPELCQQNLSQLISTLFPLTSHIESRVRTASRSLIQSVLNKVPSQHLTPLNSVINAHVCCGLSHIDTNIQLDSLKLLDVIIESSPDLVIECHQKLLPNCLDQVSLKVNKNNISSGNNAPSNSNNRTLNKNVSGKITALQWRTNVLQRVYKILSLISSKSNKSQNDSEELPRFGNVTFTENQYHLNMNGPTTSEVDMISIADVMMNWRKNPKLLNKDSNDSFKLEYFYSGLFNILLSTWCESVALLGGNGNNDKRHQNSSGLISSSILPTLEIVVKLMVVAQIDEDNSVDFEKLYGQVIKNFPYEALHQNNMSSDKKQKNNTNLEDDTTAKQLNLDICYLGFQMKNQNQEIILQLIDFIGDFQVGSQIEANKVSTIIQEITNMAGILPDTSVNGKLDNIIRQLITKYLYNESVTDCMTIISTSDFRTRISSIDAWIQQLPGILVGSRVTSNHIHAIKMLFKRRDPILMDVLTKQIKTDEADIAELWFEVNKYTPRLSNFKKSSSINV